MDMLSPDPKKVSKNSKYVDDGWMMDNTLTIESG